MSAGVSSSNSSSAPQATPSQLVSMYNTNVPTTLNAATSAVAPTVTGIANAAAGANPIYTGSVLNQLNGSGQGYAQAGNSLAQTQAAGTNQLLTGAGGQAALNAAQLNNATNPVQGAANSQATNLLNSFNLNGLSPGEQNATERSLNQTNYGTGNLGVNNGTNSIGNAMNFGGAFNTKLGALGSALNTANNTASNANTALNGANFATGAGNTSNNFGLSQFNPSQANSTLSTPFSFASSFGNQLAGVSAAQSSNSSSGSVNAGLCFLTTAACEYKNLPDDCELLTVLRKFRDEYVPKNVTEEYYRIAPRIVKALKTDREAERWYNYIYDVAKGCEEMIKNGQKDMALLCYRNMVRHLQNLCHTHSI